MEGTSDNLYTAVNYTFTAEQISTWTNNRGLDRNDEHTLLAFAEHMLSLIEICGPPSDFDSQNA